MDVLQLRFDAPLMSFGGHMVDENNVIDPFPATSLLTGLLANALGWRHGEAERLSGLQRRLVFAARWDWPPEGLIDYHTVDLGQDHLLKENGWTTRGVREDRAGGSSTGTHIRARHYHANGVMTIVLTLNDTAHPNLDDLEQSLLRPARPLFLGRKACLPAAPVLLGRSQSQGLKQALCTIPRARRPGGEASPRLHACWPVPEGGGQEVWWTDERDWQNQIHIGLRHMAVGWLTLEDGP